MQRRTDTATFLIDPPPDSSIQQLTGSALRENFSGPVEVCVNLNPVPNGASLLHFNSATRQWEDFTQRPVPTNGPICAVVNSLSPFAVAVPIQQNTAAAITSAGNATIQFGSPASFTVTSTGTPIPAISLSGILPGGILFADNGNGTAALAGTAIAGSGGLYPVTITAANGVNPNATQSFVLTVNQAPAITSANNANRVFALTLTHELSLGVEFVVSVNRQCDRVTNCPDITTKKVESVRPLPYSLRQKRWTLKPAA